MTRLHVGGMLAVVLVASGSGAWSTCTDHYCDYEVSADPAIDFETVEGAVCNHTCAGMKDNGVSGGDKDKAIHPGEGEDPHPNSGDMTDRWDVYGKVESTSANVNCADYHTGTGWRRDCYNKGGTQSGWAETQYSIRDDPTENSGATGSANDDNVTTGTLTCTFPGM